MSSALPGKGLRVGVAGVGFIGRVHIDAARSLGATVVAISGGDPERTAATADDLAIDAVYATSEELVQAPDIDVVHICTPNAMHTPLALLASRAAKHVVCEKPLAISVADAEEMVKAAGGLTAAVPFVYRYHPMVREARARVASGEVGDLRIIHGSYQQDWLARADDYSWRVDPALGGTSQAFADIGTHWCDLTEFVSGHRMVRLMARTAKTVHRNEVDGAGEDAIVMMFETDKGATGSLVVSQVSHGRKNRLWFEIDGANEAIVFDQERSEELWVGKRELVQTVRRDPNVNAPDASRLSHLPAGHAQGYRDAFTGFLSDVYTTISGSGVDGLPTFDDGLRAARITAAVLESSRDETWKEV